MSKDDISSTAKKERFATSAHFLVNNHMPTGAHNHLSRSVKAIEGPRLTMTTSYHGNLRTSEAAQHTSN